MGRVHVTEAGLPASVFLPPPARHPWMPADFAGHSRLRVFSLARWALVEALRLAGARGQAVLIPDFICRELLASLKQAGCRPAFYPVGRDLRLAVDPGELPPARAILAVDYFGLPQDLAPFEAYARRAQALIIEDNAHGFLSRDGAGRPLGTRAPLGLLSMRKTVALPDGGALLVNDESLWSDAEAQRQAAAAAAAGLEFAGRRRALRGLSRWVGARGMVTALSGARFLRKLRTGRELPACGPDAEDVIPAAPEPCPAALRPLACADPELEAQRRRGLYALCEKLLGPAGVEPVFKELPQGAAPYVYPYRARGAQAARAESLLARRGLFSLPWPALPGAVASSAPEYHACVRAAQFLW